MNLRSDADADTDAATDDKADADAATDANTDADAATDTNADIDTITDTDANADADAVTDAVATNYPAEIDTDGRRLLYDLVSTPSPTGEEAAAAERLAAFFAANGREVWIDEVGNVRAPADDSLLLTSHVDTVPGDIPVEVKPGVTDGGESGVVGSDGGERSGANGGTNDGGPSLWGRGSVDATGPLAAMAVAAVETGVSFVGVVGEETGSRGARYLIESRETVPDAVVNGEPSGWDGVTLGYRGFLAGTYVAASESGHTSRPDANAIEAAMDWWGAVEAEFDPEDYVPVFEQVTTKPVGIDGGTSDDGLSVEVTMDVQLRVPPELTPEEVRERADAHLGVGRIGGDDAEPFGSVHWEEPIPPVMESPRNEVARAFRVAIRNAGGDPRLLRKTGTSDMNLFARAWDCPMATYGPGDSSLDHSPDEHLSLAEFDRAVDVLTGVADELRDSDPDGAETEPEEGE